MKKKLDRRLKFYLGFCFIGIIIGIVISAFVFGIQKPAGIIEVYSQEHYSELAVLELYRTFLENSEVWWKGSCSLETELWNGTFSKPLKINCTVNEVKIGRVR